MKHHFTRAAVILVSATVIILSFAVSMFGGVSGTELYFPVVGRVDGGGGSRFLSTLWATNPSTSSPLKIQIQFLRAGQANTDPLSYTDTLAQGQSKKYENFVETLFGLNGALDAAWIRSGGPVLVSSRIYNQFPGEALADVQGTSFTAVPSEVAIDKTQQATLQAVTVDSDLRYALFFV